MDSRALTALAGTLVMGSIAHAALLQVVAEEYVGDGWVDNGYTDLVTYRFYAEFSGEPGDGVVAVFGSQSQGPLTWQSASGVFVNASILDSLTAPQDNTPDTWENQWDTYVTIGVTDAAGDQTQLTPGFDAEVGSLAGNFWTQNAAYFITPDQEQGLPDADNRVLIGQLTLNAGDTLVSFGLGIQDYNAVQYYIPGPGALALLGLAGLAGTRRRR
jgi:uncharacterized protein (TIGR03382 family)